MTNSLAVRLMTEADLGFADTLRSRAGWNQTRKDWQRLLNYQPDGCFVGECDGVPAGTATTTCYGNAVAWIGMVLVHPDFRRRGLGRFLLLHCLDHLAVKNIRCVKLDATPLGKTLYDQLGFRDEWPLTRWQLNPGMDSGGANAEAARDTRREGGLCDGDRLTPSQSHPLSPSSESNFLKSVRLWTAADSAATEQLDARAFGVPRREMLERLANDSEEVRVADGPDGNVAAWGTFREGSRAAYLGPVAATSPDAGFAVVRALLRTAAGRPVYWDVPDRNVVASALAKRLGFTAQRPLVRMSRGTNEWPGRPDYYFAIAEPAIG